VIAADEATVAIVAAVVDAAAAVVVAIGAADSLSEPEVQRTVLANGIPVVTERMPEARSVTTGFWVAIGGRDEDSRLAGASHFLEHLVFKGTEHRSARDIAESVDAVGGEMNAFTSREHTAYYTRLPADEISFGLDLLSDVLSEPALRPHEIDAEREVILEELALSEDTPDDKVHSVLADAMFPEHPLGREVLGDADTVAALGRDEIAGFFGEHYRPINLVIAAAGRLEHDDVVDGVKGFLEDVSPGAHVPRQPPAVAPKPLVVHHRPTEQAHIAFGWRAIDQRDPDRFALALGNQIFGGGMSSRLFQEIREQRGLAYSVYSGLSLYADSGLFMAYVGTAPNRAREVKELVEDQVALLERDGITEQELAVARGYVIGSFLLNLEDSGSRMGRLGRSELTLAERLTVDEQVERVRAATVDDVNRVMAKVLRGPRSLAAVGPFDESVFD
jgi:predicted Zn-dependent peptidase